MNMKKFFAMLMAAPMFFACTSSKVSVNAGDALLGDWQVVSAYGVNAAGAEKQPMISFQDSGKVVGNAGVNSFFGSYSLKGDTALSFENMGMTRMMGSPASMEVENAVKKALNASASIKVEGDVITLFDAEGNEALQMKKKVYTAVTPEMLKGEWNVVAAYGLCTAGAEKQPMISFQDSNVVGGNASVNSFGGSYSLTDNSALKFENMAMTQMMGADMTIEDAIVKALNATASIKADGETLIVMDAEGNEAMLLEKAAPISLAGEWNVVLAYGVSTNDAENQPFISFQDSSKVTGNAGVNTFNGTFVQADAKSLKFENMGMTRMMGSKASMAVERSVKAALDAAVSIKTDGDAVIVLDAEGKEAMMLKKK